MNDLFLSYFANIHWVCEDHYNLEFFIKRRYDLLNSILPSEVKSPCDWPAEEANWGAKGQALCHIGAKPYTTIDVDFNLRVYLASCLCNSLENTYGWWHSIHLASTIVRDPNGISTEFGSQSTILCSHDPLDYHRLPCLWLYICDVAWLPSACYLYLVILTVYLGLETEI